MDRPKLILLVGIPGSGKTYYAKEYAKRHDNVIHLSSDSIRKELWGDETTQGDNNEVFSLMQSRAIEALNNGHNVIYDATNITRKDRTCIISACPKFVKIEARIIWAPVEDCIRRDATRERTVGKEVIDRILKRFQSPFYDEGIDHIEVVESVKFDNCVYEMILVDEMKIPHDNPHHALNIYDHCQAAYQHTLKATNDFELQWAAWLHDIGKPAVKAFVDAKGNPCDIAHYYFHNNYGAWLSYGIRNTTPFVAWLICNHMEPFFNSKYYNKLPIYLKEKINLLHESDLAAH